MDNFGLGDWREDWDVEMEGCMVEWGEGGMKKWIVEGKDVIDGDMRKGIKGMSEGIGKLEKVEVLYIGN